jgi:hypothetical protein
VIVEPRKVLVVSASVYPDRGAAAIVMEKLASQFSRDEMVLVGELGMFEKPENGRGPTSPQCSYIRSRFSLMGRGARFFEPLRRQLLPAIVRRICDVAQRERCNYLLGVYPDELYCHAACQASIELDLPFSSYFHNTYMDNAAIDPRRATEIQAQIFERSEYVFVMSEGMKRFYDEKYGLGKFVPLVHTFEEYPPLEQEGSEFAQSGKTRLVLYGNFNESNMDATRRLIHAVKNDGRYELNLYTSVPRLLLRQRGMDVSAVVYHGSLGHLAFADLFAELRQYDIVVLTHGFTGAYGDVEYQTIFPTRTIPMLLSGRPILVHSPPGAYLTEFFRENNCAVVVDEPSPAAILSGLKRIELDATLRNNLVTRAMSAAEPFYGPLVADFLRERLWPKRAGSTAAPRKVATNN